ncbi:MAG: tetratricopeptide repeat-containing sensor histidine kinase [Bellilinea sp.]|jgi:signal transduction histidine kinase
MPDSVSLNVHLEAYRKLNDVAASALQAAKNSRFENPNGSIEVLKKACQQLLEDKELAQDDASWLGHCQLALGEIFIQVGKFEDALSALQDAQTSFEKTDLKKKQIHVFLALGQTHLLLASFVNALQYTLSGLELIQDSDDKAIEGRLLINLGNVYIQREEYTRALPYLLRATKDAEVSQDLYVQAEAFEKICLVYSGLNNPGMALSCGIRSLNIFKDLGHKAGEAQALNSIGRAYQSMKDYPRSLECYDDALKIARRIQFQYEIALALLRIGGVYTEQELPGQALEPLHESLDIAEKIQARGQQVICHQSLSSAYRQAVQFQRALAHYERFHEIKEHVFNDETETKLKNLEVVYQVDEARREAEREQLKNIALEQEIQERIQAQRALQSANEQLQQEIVIREQLIGDLNAFARMVAHDLKTPLQNQAILAHLIELKMSEISAPVEMVRLVQQLQEVGQKQAAIIHELLTLASLRSQEIVLLPLDMEKVIEEVLKRLNFILKDSGAEVSLPHNWPVAYGHAPWVEEVWANYLSNAVKYGGAPPVIQMGAFPEEEGFIRFWVQDNGDGLKPEDQNRLFQDFSRVDSGRVEGHGLGLSIVARIVEKLGGRVGVDSRGRAGEGCRFWFSLKAVQVN